MLQPALCCCQEANESEEEEEEEEGMEVSGRKSRSGAWQVAGGAVEVGR